MLITLLRKMSLQLQDKLFRCGLMNEQNRYTSLSGTLIQFWKWNSIHLTQIYCVHLVSIDHLSFMTLEENHRFRKLSYPTNQQAYVLIHFNLSILQLAMMIPTVIHSICVEWTGLRPFIKDMWGLWLISLMLHQVDNLQLLLLIELFAFLSSIQGIVEKFITLKGCKLSVLFNILLIHTMFSLVLRIWIFVCGKVLPGSQQELLVIGKKELISIEIN